MNFRIEKLDWKVLGAGLAVIVVTNAVALAGVAYNRSGEPDAVVELSERELGMPYRYGMNKENTGLALRINCRVETAQHYTYGNSDCSGNPAWLDREKLIELRFKLQPQRENATSHWRYQRELPRKVYLVLEFNGAAHQRTVANAEEKLNEQRSLLADNPGKDEFEKRVEQAEEYLQTERHKNSRLFAIDAGLDTAALRITYPDASRYIFMQALVRPTWNQNKKKDKWIGTITDLLIDSINIPLEHRAVFDPLEDNQRRRNRNAQKPRYSVRVAFGKRAEPWVMAVGKQ